MKLTAFRIKNFRSIIDTGWQSVSPDNITCLIGQNESGKTSILEALFVFHTGQISEDILRSDLSLPEVSCRFSIERGWLLTVVPNAGAELKELMASMDTFELTRYWMRDFTSAVRASGEISDYIDSLEKAWRLYLDAICEKIAEEDIHIRQEESLIREKSDERRALERSLRVHRAKGRGLFNRKEGSRSNGRSEMAILKSKINDLSEQIDAIGKSLDKKGDLITAVTAWTTMRNELAGTERQLREVSLRLDERHQMMTLLMSPEEYQEEVWEAVVDEYQRLRAERDRQNSEIDRQTALCGYLMDGLSGEEAMLRVQEMAGKYRAVSTAEMIGRISFEHTPVFTIFEDFGSLLPNRIDLDEIVRPESNIEGYKAARNFLRLARLDYSFFLQPSSRILKQTIENLNQSLTRNFHDFWQQSVGGQNKIRIQFELEHYSSTHGSKAGKPYLEFWIKDEGERLYPKQRSRGVRWFLSFYLELQASALSEGRSLVLLVDEPGVSLHARAQEDVLRVFEDISHRIQVIYTTHSPHLVDVGKLHRVLAIQRDDFDNYRSGTRVLDSVKLASATPDTLSPLYSIMGNPPGAGFSGKKTNFIVSDTAAYYMISGILKLTGSSLEIAIVPATNAASIPSLCNIMLGWGFNFRVLIFGNHSEEEAASQVEAAVARPASDFIIHIGSPVHAPEDLFSTIDFKRHLIRTREGITIPNSVYLAENNVPRSFLASRFLSDVDQGKLTGADFDEESQENFRMLVNRITSQL